MLSHLIRWNVSPKWDCADNRFNGALYCYVFWLSWVVMVCYGNYIYFSDCIQCCCCILQTPLYYGCVSALKYIIPIVFIAISWLGIQTKELKCSFSTFPDLFSQLHSFMIWTQIKTIWFSTFGHTFSCSCYIRDYTSLEWSPNIAI